ncbi:MAG: hypothetical protein M3004_01005 [Bacteroidota bacterium]|nr:hypothetical protein [Bacteroidota bacterium]
MKKNLKHLAIATVAILGLMCISNFTKAQNDDMSSNKMKNTKMKMKDDKVKMKMDMAEIKSWPMSSQMAIKEMMDKYGKPNEVTPTMMIWNNNGMWKKTIVSKEENKHDFPKTHMDCMEQIVYYKVPIDKARMLDEFDGSINIDRTQGFLSARCDKEENNLLALNLAYDIITGKKNVAEARNAYGEMIKQAMSGNKPEYMKKLMFSSNMNAPDSDVNTIGM